MSALTNFLARGVVALANSASKLQSLQLRLLAGEVKDQVEHLEPYGFTACPHDGAEALAGFIGGDRSHGVVIVVADRRFRLQGLSPGEVAMYTDEGDKLHFKRDRIIDIETVTLNVKATQSVNFDTPLIKTTGRIESDGDQVAGGVSQINHPHEGVQSGNGQSGPPVGGT
ncbi:MULTISPECIES: phage baseplate assembly protein V [unclassified Pseudomonas]|uniref:phage baseplate assembly protein V n=1 Tax=unclassified Pseudomonas TaxID=196821 RepID=UPI000C881186|nr:MULTISPECIES: phage baseplate assembly protein V [unclassified Pseudomonas]PMX16914.1 phage baseplate assembly protein V [Pseudomonas sp. MPBC4-3]PMX44410.1 phage baseplate assembly protein V [Pseudomonas sp. FW301-21B01]PMY03546.1 phage baseplate assembly protein V [Pseudomonas sp. MPR-R5A]PMY06796.1 phage baseplate assembly protein V [Pseudomonas sp. MPR-R2A5]PNA61914.1 phage baseplate assembly protein V [Pseudomonas sp. MPR-R5B]